MRVLALGALLAVVSGCTHPRAIEVDGARMLARVKHQVEAGPRFPGSPGHDVVRDWIVSELTRLGARVEQQAFIDSSLGRPLALVNLIGHYGPQSGRRIVLAAHWDTREFADHDPDSTRHRDPVPGANDGGSGVAVLLEVAELMATRAPAIGVDLVFFDGEDQGTSQDPESFCLGSSGYAARLAPGTITAAFVFDMVGDRKLAIHPEVVSAERASNLSALVVEGARATGGSSFHEDPMIEVYDDHRPLLDAGVPAVDIIDFEYLAWHTTQDLPDQLSEESLAEVARVAAWLVYQSPLAAP